MKSIFNFIFVAVLLVVSPGYAAENSNQADISAEADPYKLFEQVTTRAFERFKSDWPKVKDDPEVLKQIIRDELLPYIDFEYAAYKVLGKYVRTLEKDELKQFVAVFQDYIVTIYAQLFINYRETQTIVVEPSVETDSQKIVVVKSKIVEPGRPDISLTFKLIQRQAKWRAFDMEAEGISVLSTKRNEIASEISKVGIKGVIDDLNQKASQRLVIKSEDEKAA